MSFVRESDRHQVTTIARIICLFCSFPAYLCKSKWPLFVAPRSSAVSTYEFLLSTLSEGFFCGATSGRPPLLGCRVAARARRIVAYQLFVLRQSERGPYSPRPPRAGGNYVRAAHVYRLTANCLLSWFKVEQIRSAFILVFVSSFEYFIAEL